MNGFINAQSANNLYVYATAFNCMNGAQVNPPNNGDAILEQSNGNQNFRNLIVNAVNPGPRNIIIDCSDNNEISTNDCQNMNVDGSTADYLEINMEGVGGGLNCDTSCIIRCPTGNGYSGSEPSSCMVKAEGTDMRIFNPTFYATAGIPGDLWINIPDWATFTQYNNVKVSCTNGLTTIDRAITASDNDCINSHTTPAPVPAPSNQAISTFEPTTSIPSSSPSTINPSSSPSKSPSNYPSNAPSASISPSSAPTIASIPTLSPTDLISSPSPTQSDPNIIVPNTPTTTPTFADGAAINQPTSAPFIARNAVVESSKGMNSGIAVLIVFLVLGLCILGIYGLWRYRKTRDRKDLEAMPPTQAGKNNVETI